MKNHAIPQEINDRQSILMGNPNNGNMIVFIYDEDMEARAEFIPSRDGGTPLNPELINLILKRLDIVHGIQWGIIQETMIECNKSGKPIRDVIIARGDRPQDEVSEYYEMNPHLIQQPLPAGTERRIDYRAWSPFIIVKRNQTLARFHPKKDGIAGKNIRGAAVPFEVCSPVGVSGGKNTRIEGKFIVADIDGQFIENKNVLTVEDSLTIKGPVGYATGNIIFPGDVTINGPVADGFKIYSGGSVTIKQTFDMTDAVIKGDLNVSGGIIGRGQAMVKAGGGIRAKFIENCRAAARKAVIIEREIINASIFTLENIEMGDRGIILGGDMYAVKGIRTGGIGRKEGRSTRIHCGIDFTVDQEKEKHTGRLRIIAAKLKRLRDLMETAREGTEDRIKMDELLQKLEEEQQKTSEKISELLGRLITCEDAVVEVTGDIVPGTLIEICQAALFVSAPLKHVRVRLDRELRTIITEKL
ncbi:polymerase [Spirochaetia bacterium]|nr:polymerase [Spirochaetia bacterium]